MNPSLERMIYFWFGVIIMVAAFLIAVAVRQAMATDSFVQMLERRQGVSPGSTKVWPDCSCTVRYLGTTVRGRHYDVHLERLD